jgi:hypothetical protein
MSKLPYKNDSALDLHSTYKMIGYGLTATSSNPMPDNYFVQTD